MRIVRPAVGAVFGCALLLLGLPCSRDCVAASATVDVPFEYLVEQVADDPSRFAVAVPHRAKVTDAGGSSVGGRTRWTYSVRVPGAVSLSFHATPVMLPLGATVKVSGRFGSFTYTTSDVRQGHLWSRVLRGDTLTVEIAAPEAMRRNVAFNLVELQAGYRGLGASAMNHPAYDRHLARARVNARAKLGWSATTTTATSACIENYECNATESTRAPSRSTVGLVIANLVQCTGTLVNNARQDGTPYVLTARHCQQGRAGGGMPTAASTTTVYWLATTPCGTPLGDLYDPSIVTQHGATTVYEQQDAWLIRLDRDPVVAAPYFAGFDASGAAFVGGYSIHHALSTKQQRVTWFGQAVPASFTAGQLGVGYDSSFWGVSSQSGFYGPGASGAALFDSFNRIVGTASLGRERDGGPGVCPLATPQAPTPTTADGYFTSVGALWRSSTDPTSGSGATTLASILDPDGSGVLIVDGAAGLTRVSLGASAQTIGIDRTLQLYWSATGAATCTASGGSAGDGWAGPRTPDGSMTISNAIVGVVTYEIACSYPSGRTSRASTSVTWTVPEPSGGLSSVTGFVWLGAPYVVRWSANTGPCTITTTTPTGPGSDVLTGLLAEGSATVTFTRLGEGQANLACGPGEGRLLAGTLYKVQEPDVTYFANSTDRVLGQPLSLVWYSIAEYCTPSGGAPNDGWVIAQRDGNSGFLPNVTQIGTFEYRLRCVAGDVAVNRSLTVRVSNDAPYVSLSMPRTTLRYGEQYEIAVRSNIDNCYLSGMPNSTSPQWVSAETRMFGYATDAGTYTLQVSCDSKGLKALSERVTFEITGGPPIPPTVTLTLSAVTVQAGQSLTVNWSSSADATRCEASGHSDFAGSVPPAGVRTFAPASAGAFQLSVTCWTAGGVSGFDATNLTVTAPPAPPSGGGNNSGGGGGGGGGAVELLGLLMLTIVRVATYPVRRPVRPRR